MKTVKVVAAILCDDFHQITKILTTQRGYGPFKGAWEFPGGKVEEMEGPKEALKREIKEELGIEIHVGRLVETVEYDYSDFHLSMDCFLCEISCGQIQLIEHLDQKWITANEVKKVEWLPADITLVPILEALFSKKKESER